MRSFPALAVPVLVAVTLMGREAVEAEPGEYFRIRVRDEQTGRGVPLVELETVNRLLFVTDSAGLVAFREPALMNQEVFFSVRSHGYEFKKDGFGYAGTRFVTKPGGSVELKVRRLNLAERLYRITGEGIYRDTVLLGERPPLAEPLLNAQVAGQDSVMALPYRGQIYWFWGDTQRPKYPLGHFRTAGATSELPGRGGLAPDRGVDLSYFRAADGFSQPLIDRPGPGPIWLDGVLTVPGPDGTERLIGHYSRMKDLGTVLEHGLVVFNDATKRFDKLVEFPVADQTRRPHGHPVRYRDAAGDFFYFPCPFPVVRVRADWKDLQTPEAYEVLSAQPDAGGKVVWAWGQEGKPAGQAEERALIRAGKLPETGPRWQLAEAAPGKPAEAHASSVAWNAYRKRWVMIFTQKGGTSPLGEIWIAESASLTGPWLRTKKIVTHDRYTFYNPEQHPFFAEQDGRVIYFEGTYTAEFSGNPCRTPRYDYNQILYRLDLGDPRLEWAAP